MLIVQFAVGFVARAVFAAAARARLVSIASRTGAATSGFGARARIHLAGALLGDALYDLVVDLRPDMADRENWARQSAEAMAEEILATARGSYLQGPAPQRLERRTGESARNLAVSQGADTVSVGSPDSWMRDFEERDDTPRWQDREWLQPATDDVLQRAPDDWVEAWRAQARA